MYAGAGCWCGGGFSVRLRLGVIEESLEVVFIFCFKGIYDFVGVESCGDPELV